MRAMSKFDCSPVSPGRLEVQQVLTAIPVFCGERQTRLVSLDLRESGYEPVVAPDVTSGLHQARALQPALIVVDRLLAGGIGTRVV